MASPISDWVSSLFPVIKCDFGHAEILAHGLLVSFVCRNAKGRVEEPQSDLFISSRPYSYFSLLLQHLPASEDTQHLRPQRVREKLVFENLTSFCKPSPFWIYRKLYFPVLIDLHNQRRYEITVLGKNMPRDKSL